MSTSIHSGGLITKDPNSQKLYTMDWDQENLATSVTITTSDWAITGPDAVLTKDNPSILAGGRRTQVRLLAGTVGKTYTVTNTIVTSESPTQTKERSFKVLIEQK